MQIFFQINTELGLDGSCLSSYPSFLSIPEVKGICRTLKRQAPQSLEVHKEADVGVRYCKNLC